jgi:hypothetical protein
MAFVRLQLCLGQIGISHWLVRSIHEVHLGHRNGAQPVRVE